MRSGLGEVRGGPENLSSWVTNHFPSSEHSQLSWLGIGFNGRPRVSAEHTACLLRITENLARWFGQIRLWATWILMIY